MVRRVLKKSNRVVRLTLAGAAHPRRTVANLKASVVRRGIHRNRENEYLQWFKKYERQANDIAAQQEAIAAFKYKPLISIILPIYNTPEPFLRACIQSVISQSYTNWELCVADDASTTPIIETVKDLAKKHPNIKWTRLQTNRHIAASSNEALKLAKGEFVALLDHDDLLLPNALYESVKAINEHPDVDLVYSDEDKVDGNRHIEPFFKPDWSPDFLLGCNYITHFAVLRRSIVEKIGGFRVGTEGAQDWDLFLRFTAQTQRVHHIPKILYSWRKSPTSTAKTAKSKPYAYINQMRVLRDAMVANRTPASVLSSPFMGFWFVKHTVQKLPLVSIIIPTKDNYDVIKNCLDSIIENTTYPAYEIVIVDTGSTDGRVDELYKKMAELGHISVVRWKKPFNFSGACNFGAKHSKGEYLLFLNNDTEVITPEWIEYLLGQAQRKEVGMVGCRLWFPTHRLQHAGVVLSKRDIAFHPFYNQDPKLDIFINIFASNIRNCSAVTAACCMVSREKFNEAGGFDEKLRVTYNDVDLCLRLLDKGYRNVYTPYAELYHYESLSIGKITARNRDQEELAAASNLMRQRWGDKYLNRDPYYNDNFMQHGPGYRLTD